MYTMVLMMAVTSSGDVSGFGHRNKGCNGAEVATGCTGAVAADYSASCMGGTSCQGSGSSRGGFLGLRGKLFGRNKGGNSCMGDAAAYTGCTGGAVPYTGCTGGAIPYTGCTGGVPAVADFNACPPGVIGMPPATTPPPPVVMPKTEEPKPKIDPKKPVDPKVEDKNKTESN